MSRPKISVVLVVGGFCTTFNPVITPSEFLQMHYSFSSGFRFLNSRPTGLALVLAFFCFSVVVVAQESKESQVKPPPKVAPEQAKKPAIIKISKDSPRAITVKVDDVALTEVASKISSGIKIPVNLSDLMRKQKVSVDFEGLTLEPAMRLLAPQVYVDYEYSGDPSAPPKALAVYLYGYNETPPALTATVKGNSETLMIEGNTEDSTEAPSPAGGDKNEKPLEIKFDKRLVSLKSKSQPLTVVLAELAGSMGIPFELRYESREVVNTNFDSYRIEDAIQRLSPNVRLYLRSDLQRAENIPLRLVLVAPAKS